jgi:hypothetical protein
MTHLLSKIGKSPLIRNRPFRQVISEGLRQGPTPFGVEGNMNKTFTKKRVACNKKGSHGEGRA